MEHIEGHARLTEAYATRRSKRPDSIASQLTDEATHQMNPDYVGIKEATRDEHAGQGRNEQIIRPYDNLSYSDFPPRLSHESSRYNQG